MHCIRLLDWFALYLSVRAIIFYVFRRVTWSFSGYLPALLPARSLKLLFLTLAFRVSICSIWFDISEGYLNNKISIFHRMFFCWLRPHLSAGTIEPLEKFIKDVWIYYMSIDILKNLRVINCLTFTTLDIFVNRSSINMLCYGGLLIKYIYRISWENEKLYSGFYWWKKINFSDKIHKKLDLQWRHIMARRKCTINLLHRSNSRSVELLSGDTTLVFDGHPSYAPLYVHPTLPSHCVFCSGRLSSYHLVHSSIKMLWM